MAGYVTGAMFIMAISWYLLRGQRARCRITLVAIGSVFGTLAIIGTLQLGDSSAYEVAQVQPVKLAAMEGGVANGTCTCTVPCGCTAEQGSRA